MQKFPGFFTSIIDPTRYKNIDSVFVVMHANVEFNSFLTALGSVIRIAGVIPKASSKKFANIDVLRRYYPVFDIDRSRIISNPDKFIATIDSLTKNERFAIIDMGGYFSHVAIELAKKFDKRMVGIVEDTENGHQKYEALIGQKNSLDNLVPVISVARSSLKEPEDALVGQAIVFSAEVIMRSHGLILLGKRVGVIGFGKIGRSIAFSLLSRGSRVDVFDSNPILLASALSLGFHTSLRSDFLRSADILFCATGNKSLSSADEVYFKDRLHIFCATSSDDELSACLRHKIDTTSLLIRRHTCKILLQNKCIYIHNEGNSVNFVHGAVVDRFIELVQGEIIYSMGSLHDAPRNAISYLPENDKKFIAQKWITHHQQV
jgi:adenosylhomocysteinase